MNLFTWALFGIILGVVANFLDPRPTEGGIIGAIILGVVGAFLGGVVSNILIGSGNGGFNFTSLSIALLGSLLLLLIGRAVRRT